MLETSPHGECENRWARPRKLVLLAGLAGAWLLTLAGIAEGQIIDAWSLGTGFDPRPLVPKARLEAMGGMREAVPDENNEINLLDFGGNLVGHLDDKPTHHLDAWGGWRGWVDRTTPEAPDQDFRFYPAGFLGNALPNGRYAIGGSMRVMSGGGERVVSDEFLRLFGLPIVNPEAGSNLGTTVESDLTGAAFSTHYARQLADRFSFGLLGGYETQDEARVTPSTYNLDSDSHTWAAKGSVAGLLFKQAGPLENWVLGLNSALSDTRIDGLSSDDLHTDNYTWDRNSFGLNLHLLGEVTAWAKGGLDFRYGSFEGQEWASYNWSPQYSLNPTSGTVLETRTVHEEGFRDSGFLTRWQIDPPDLPASFGLGFNAAQTEYWLLPGTNVNSFVTARSQQVTAWEARGGGTYFLPQGRGLLAGEMVWGWSDRDERISPPTDRVGASTFELGTGGEYAVGVPLVARAGYRYIRGDENRDVDDPAGEASTHRLALGAGYRTASGAIALDLAFSYDWVSSDAETPGVGDQVVEDRDRKLLTLQLRSLFF